MKKAYIVGGVVASTLLVATGACFLFKTVIKDEVVEDEPVVEVEPEPIPEPKIVSAEARYLYAGTTFWGRRTNTLARASELGVAYPFSQLSTLEPESYDAWIGGLECPVTEKGGIHDEYAEENLFEFNCDPDYLVEAKKYFDVFGLGNNHTDNQGEEGFVETKTQLANAGIQYYGVYEYYNGDNCNVISLPIRVKYDDGSEKKMQIPYALCSAHGVFGIPTNDVFANIAKYSTNLQTIVTPHMGAEYQPSADTLRQNLFRRMIDESGADAVIGDHPHWMQNAEAWNGKLIVYSMGNFMFDQLANAEVVRSAAIEANAKIDVTGVDLEAWDAIAKKCKTANGACLDDIAASGLPKLKIDWKYDFHATTSANNSITRLGDESEQASAAQRLNWYALPEELKVAK